MLSWITPTNHLGRLGWCLTARQFQSLLSWITPTNRLASPARRLRTRCFNPCCPGSRPPTGRKPATSVARPSVSILVVLDHAHQRREYMPGSANVGFQSLLSWITPTNSRSGRSARSAHTGFQSLLSWITPTNACNPGPGAPRAGGFNPCCPGSRPPTHHIAAWWREGHQFQSLLSWITPTNMATGKSLCRWLLVFQSLLSWITPTNANGPESRVQAAIVFQSLLSWITPTNAPSRDYN